MIYIGIDPGKKGGWAVIQPNAEPIVCPWDDTFFVSDIHGIVDMARERRERIVAAVEKVCSMPHDSHKAAFNFGHSLGYIEGVLISLGIPYQLVPPMKWKKEFSLIGKDKKASIDTCKRLFPELNLRRTDKCRTDSDGLAESTLLAEYARRKF